MCRKLALVVTMACLLGLVAGMCEAQTKSKKKEAEKFENQKAVMKEMGPCAKEMMGLRDKLEKEKMFTTQAKLRKDIAAQGERMAELAEGWKPFVKGDKATKLQEDLLKASTELAKVGKFGGKKMAAMEGVTAVQTACGECHKGYKPKDEAGEKKGAETK
jgi:hypothetical protein